ncbi:hypothetical protein J5N97_003565 [Dioscorea zingiberensis]|uniref:Uncharacterized protein n=1 Tax=Dioscorea zingiberensis TaxID=325984 RepID=A0A9D5D627_9LILI|nr:hypothetical protein J5N97_003565 [Dioscorea zingiberensis]
MAVTGNGHAYQSAHLSPSARHAVEDDDGDHTRPIQDSGLHEEDQTFGSTGMDIDSMVKGKRQACPSPPLLLLLSLDQRPESSNAAHRRLVERVEQALGANKVCSESQNDLDSLDEDSGLEDSADERTLWDFQKCIQKGSQARKGVQMLSSVQKKKIQKKKKAKGLIGGKGS